MRGFLEVLVPGLLLLSRWRICFLAIDQAQRCRVHAEALPGRSRTVVEDVAEMSVAATAEHFCPFHVRAVVVLETNAVICQRLPEAWPAGAGIELGSRVE